MHTSRKKIIIFLTIFLVYSPIISTTKTPKLSIIFVVDQFAYHYLYKIKPFLTGGIKFLIDNGIFYENAHYPHAKPETAVGHVALNTGVYPIDHGIIGNQWYDEQGKYVEADDADVKDAAVFGPNNTLLDYGKSGARIMVDGLTDQFVLHAQPNASYLAFSFSIKSRSAVATATKLGKAIWFDKDTGIFTSSKAYFDAMPPWVVEFNKKMNLPTTHAITWNLYYPRDNEAYDFKNIQNYTYSSEISPIVGTTMPIDPAKNPKEPYGPVYSSPYGNQLLLDITQTCIEKHLTKKALPSSPKLARRRKAYSNLNEQPACPPKPFGEGWEAVHGNSHLLLWVCLSPLDLIGHQYGPDSLECIDLIYHLDQQLKKFMKTIEKKVGKSNVLYALTADHGILPMQGILQENGIKTAYKIMYKDVIEELNAHIKKTYQLDTFIAHYEAPTFYVDQKHRANLSDQEFDTILQDIKKILLKKSGIKNVWTWHELETRSFNLQQEELESYFKNQRYLGRSGQLFVQLQPYCLLTKYPKGTSHESPYNHDTHVPLAIYQKGVYEKKKVTQKVYMTQFANSMAQILNIAHPSASTAQLLPGIFDDIIEETLHKEVMIKQENAQC